MKLSLPFLALALSVHADIIPSSRLVPWVPGVTVGVPGGIPTRTNIVTVTCDNTGATDVSAAINAAIANASANTVVYLPAGYYSLSNTIVLKSLVTLRGSDPSNTFIMPLTTNGLLTASAAISPPYPTEIIAGSTKGSSNVTFVADMSAYYSVGDIMTINRANSQGSAPYDLVFSSRQYERVDQQLVVLTAANAGHTVYTFWPPLVHDYTNTPYMSFVTYAKQGSGYTALSGIGVENLTFTASNTVTHYVCSAVGLAGLGTCVNSWVTNCVFDFSANYNFTLGYAVSCYFGHNWVRRSQSGGSNHAGLLLGEGTGLLIEDCIFSEYLTPSLEFNDGFTGNAIFGCYFHSSVPGPDCHNTHSRMNLWEANIIDRAIEFDGYFGSCSYHTLFRNAITDPWTPVYFKRWTTYMNLVGNVLGTNGVAYTNFSHDIPEMAHNIVEEGRPDLGDQYYSGTNPPVAWNCPGNIYLSPGGYLPYIPFVFTNDQGPTTTLTGNFSYVPDNTDNNLYPIVFQDNVDPYLYHPNDGTPLFSVGSGTTTSLTVSRPVTVHSGYTLYVAGVRAYLQLQTLDRWTHLIAGNFDYYNNAVTWGTNTVQTIPKSLLYTNGAPSWWGTNRWPAVDPQDSTTNVTMIPAMERFFGFPVGNTTNSPAETTQPGSVSPGMALMLR